MSADADPPEIPDDVEQYDAFSKTDGAEYERVRDLLKERVKLTPREWALARLCSDFRTETGVEMTKIGKHLPELVPFMEDSYSPQAVNEGRNEFDRKVRRAGATFLYGALCDFYTADELDEIMYEATEVAKFLLEVEGADLDAKTEQEVEEKLRETMQEVRRASRALQHTAHECPHCEEPLPPEDDGD